MINITQKWIVKLILIVVALSIVTALLSSGAGCYSPIEEIFMGWRDTSDCDVSGDLQKSVSKNSKDIGGIVLTLVLFFIISIFSFIKIIKKLHKKTSDEEKR